MKKIMILLVSLMVVVNTTTAQIIGGVTVIADDHATITLSNGYRYDKGTVPGGAWMGVGTNFANAVNTYLQRIYVEDGAQAYQEALTRWQLTKPVGYVDPSTISVNPMTGMGMVGGTMMMTGNGMMMTGVPQGQGYVIGAGGAATAQSQLEITNSNMLATLGSGTQVYTDLNGNVQVGGDVLMGLARVASAIGGSKKAKKAAKAADGMLFVDNAGNQYILNNGVLYRVQGATTTRGTNVTPTTTRGTTTTTTTAPRTNTGNGFVSGY